MKIMAWHRQLAGCETAIRNEILNIMAALSYESNINGNNQWRK
jgi:hypothetical protein